MINTDILNVIFRIIRNIAGGLFCFAGLGGVITGSIVLGIFLILLGITLLPILYERVNFSEFKYASIVLPVVCFVLLLIFVPNNKSEVNENSILLKLVQLS